MGVPLRCVYVSMSECFLNRSDARLFEQSRGEGMPEYVGADRSADDAFGEFGQPALQSATGDRIGVGFRSESEISGGEAARSAVVCPCPVDRGVELAVDG